MDQKYFSEVSRVLQKYGVQTAAPEQIPETELPALPVLLRGQTAFHVLMNGASISFGAPPHSQAVMDLYTTISPITITVRKYVTAMELASLLEADALQKDYRLLAAFNDIVLAGRESEDGGGYQFVTWERCGNRATLYAGHDCGDNFSAAKTSFAVRSGLVDQHQLFCHEQLAELLCCVQDKMEHDDTLTTEQTDLLYKTAEQIENAVPDLEGLRRQLQADAQSGAKLEM